MRTIGTKKLLIGLGLASVFLGTFFGSWGSTKELSGPTEELLGSNLPNSKWFVYDTFTGFQTKDDPNKVEDGANPQGQNTFINNGDRISIRNLGYQIFPDTATASTTATGITSLHTFRKRSGTNIQMRAYGTVLEWYDTTNNAWENLNSGYTSGQDFGFADYNINTDLVSYVYFGNGVEDFSRWTGAITNLNGALSGGEGTITVDSTTDGFTTTGSLRICATTVTYSGKTDTTFTGASGTPACADDKGISQVVLTDSSDPKGNLYLVADNRLFISGSTSTPQAVFFSAYGDATDFTGAALVTDSTAESPGIFNLGEGGGAVTGMAEDEGSIYFFKETAIRKATLSDSLYTLSNLKPFDGRSQTVGALNDRTIFSGANGIFFITPDDQIMNLTRVDDIDYPQIIPISDAIKPTIEAAVWDDATGIFWEDKAYFAAKTDTNSSFNDVVFIYNFRINAWESPIVGWGVGDWTIYDDADGNGAQLYFGHVNNPNSYKITRTPLDDVFGVSANWRSKPFDFGIPHFLKEMDSIFVEGYIADNTTLTISLLLDEDGYTQVYTTEFVGTETDYLFDAPSYNVFGFQAFGTERFGSNDDFSGLRKFRIYLNKDFRPDVFYNAQLEFASDGENQQWEVTRYGFSVREYTQPEDRALYRAFN